MPDLPTLAGGPGDVASTPASSTGISLPCPVSTNTKATNFTQLIASTAYASNWLLVTLNAIDQNNGAALVDIALGASTSEQVIISNLYYHSSTAASLAGRTWLFPLRIPAGTRISGKAQSNIASAALRCTVHTISSPIDAPPGLTRVETCGAVTGDTSGLSVDCGGTINTDVVGELIASTGFDYSWFCLAIGCPADQTWGGLTHFLVDLCVGAGGAETPVISDLYFAGSSTDDKPSPSTVCFPVAIAAGSRLTVRARCSVNTASERILDYVGYGVG